MLKRILPILLLLLPYLYIVPFYKAAENNDQSFSNLRYFGLWIILFLVFFVLNIIFVSFRVLHKEKSELFLFWSMILKLCHIPVYLIVFLIGMILTFIPIGFVLLPFFIIFDYLLLILTSIYGISGVIQANNPELEKRVNHLNDYAIKLINSLAQFKSNLLSNVLSCNIFTVNYPLLIDHILREARFYSLLLQRLQSREDINLEKEAYEQEAFWNRIMAEHAKFIRGLLDPTEDDLINTANNFGNEFDQLLEESKRAMDRTIPLNKVTTDSLNATIQIRDFKRTAAQGLLECKIKSIILPLLGDHVLREANHYLRLLNMFDKKI